MRSRSREGPSFPEVLLGLLRAREVIEVEKSVRGRPILLQPTPRHRRVIALRNRGMSLQEVGERLGITREAVRQIAERWNDSNEYTKLCRRRNIELIEKVIGGRIAGRFERLCIMCGLGVQKSKGTLLCRSCAARRKQIALFVSSLHSYLNGSRYHLSQAASKIRKHRITKAEFQALYRVVI
jgi:predicted transcriptional regulator